MGSQHPVRPMNASVRSEMKSAIGGAALWVASLAVTTAGGVVGFALGAILVARAFTDPVASGTAPKVFASVVLAGEVIATAAGGKRFRATGYGRKDSRLLLGAVCWSWALVLSNVVIGLVLGSVQ